jgi:small-conductance mechanosensitive channel
MFRLLFLCFGVVFWHASLYGQDPACHPVRLDDHHIIDICWGYGPVSVQKRAEAISERLRQIAEDPASPDITVSSDEVTVGLFSGEVIVAAVFPTDAARAKTSQEQLARSWAAAFEQGIKTYRQEHSWRAILRRLALSALLFAGTVLLLFAIAKGMRKLHRIAAAWLERRIQSADARVIALLPNQVTRTLLLRAFALIRFTVSLFVLYAVAQLLLGIFPGTRGLAKQLYAAVLRHLQSFGAAAWGAMPSLAFVVLVAVAAWYIVKLNRYIFHKIGEGVISLRNFRPTWAATTQRLINILVVILAVLIAYPYIPGSDSDAFKGVSLFIGVLVSLGSTGLVSNVVSGIMLTYIDAFQPGDYVTIGDETGTVLKASAFTTQLQTRAKRTITIPNASVLGNRIVNYNALSEHGIVASATVEIGYDVPWRQVEGLLKLAASRAQSARSVPEPFVLERSLNQCTITYELNAFVKPGILLFAAEADLHRNVIDAFNEYGVQIMTPSYEGDPETPKIVEQPRWRAAPASSSS